MAEKPVLWGPGEGRHYDMGALQAVFKADEREIGGRFSISEWWLEPRHEGPGAHKHDDNDEIFYVLEGVASILIGDQWKQMPKGAMCIIPRGVMHDFRNEGQVRMGLFNVFLPGPFEQMMPEIVDWYRDNPARPL
ncbi:cupin domain-containing protein [Rhizobiaceae bacterium n13]|uniref:Cupin domain-containing protein n=1 Tax=Ferirhizobium litorale TaxID=2927786 RepID=A0AAE3U432_9HYPH|nr:cupin domain-containing protein [Fererhizobium litorale]MDI7863273.1 cupin domain-containing protein [Fererhizobium litorale]MDI7922993.1 cupin domain-containing protein [Fererhizobium litorale]